MSRKLLIFCAFAVFAPGLLCGQTSSSDAVAYPTRPMGPPIRREDSTPTNGLVPSHRIIANLYYVGNGGISTWLITSEQGHIMIDPGWERNVPSVQKNVESLGFRFHDIKIILASHAHPDHTEGAALVKKLTGAQLMVMAADVETVETGGTPESQGPMPPVHIDRVLHDKDEVSLGGNTLVAHWTPGHSKGNTTWVWQVQEGGKIYTVNVTGSLSVNEARWLVSLNAPTLVEQYRQAYRVLKNLPCDVFLSGHANVFNLNEKYAKSLEGGPNPYIDPEGYRAYISENEKNFYYMLDYVNRWIDH
jgi:metallo-beta-lactamase class B